MLCGFFFLRSERFEKSGCDRRLSGMNARTRRSNESCMVPLSKPSILQGLLSFYAKYKLFL